MQILAVATVAWAVVTITILMTDVGRGNRSVWWSIALTVAFALPLLPIALQRSILGIFGVAIPYLWGPLLLGYTRTLVSDDKPWRWIWLLHLLPALAWLVLALVFPDLRESIARNTPVAATAAGMPPPGGAVGPVPAGAPATGPAMLPPPDLNWKIYGLCNAASVLVYGVVTAIVLRRASRVASDYHSTLVPETTLSWLRFLVIVYIAGFSTAIALLLVLDPEVASRYQLPGIVQHVPVAAFIFVFAVFGTRQRQVFAPEAAETQQIGSEPRTGSDRQAKYERSGLSESEASELISRLHGHMEDHRPFLRDELTLADLAEELDVSRHHLSQVINSSGGANFYRFVNEYRIREFENQVRAGKDQLFSLTGLALECGFRSVSAFYAAMKQLRDAKPRDLVARIHAESA